MFKKVEETVLDGCDRAGVRRRSGSMAKDFATYGIFLRGEFQSEKFRGIDEGYRCSSIRDGSFSHEESCIACMKGCRVFGFFGVFTRLAQEKEAAPHHVAHCRIFDSATSPGDLGSVAQHGNRDRLDTLGWGVFLGVGLQ